MRSAASSRERSARAIPSSSVDSRVRISARRRSAGASRSRAASLAVRTARARWRAAVSALAASRRSACARRLGLGFLGRLARRLRLIREIAQAVLLHEPPRGGRGRLGRGDEAVPPPEIAFPGNEPLPGLQLRAQSLPVRPRDDSDLRQPARQRGRRLDSLGEALDAGRQRGIVGRGGVPDQCAGASASGEASRSSPIATPSAAS